MRTFRMGPSGFLCVRQLGQLIVYQFPVYLQAPARPREEPRLGYGHMVLPVRGSDVHAG